MAADDSELCTSIHYKPDVRPSILLAFGLGLQPAILFVAGIVLTAAIVVHAGGGTEGFLSWAVFTLVRDQRYVHGAPGNSPEPDRKNPCEYVWSRIIA